MAMAFALAILAPNSGSAQVINYPFGAADYQTVTATNDSVQFSTDNQWTFVSSSIDSNTVVKCTAGSEIRTGALLFVELTADGTNRTVTFTGLTAPSTTFTASKTRIMTFVYRGGYKLISSAQID